MSLKTVFRWHLWLGLISGLFMFLVGMTGAVAVFIEEIDWLVTPGLRVSAPADATRASAGDVVAAVREAYPDGRITSLRLSERPRFAHTVSVQQPRPQRGVQVFVDPVTAEITGTRAISGGYTASVRNFIRQSHVRLLMGLWGRVFVGVLGVVLVLSCVTGLWVYRGWIKKMFQWHLTGKWRQRPAWAELHKFIGVWSLLFNVVIGATGAVLGLENLHGQINRHWLQPSPTEAKAAAAAKPAAPRTEFARGEPLGVEALLARAAAEFPDLAVRSIDFPARPNTPVSLRGDVPSVLMMQSHVRRASSLALDPVSGAVISKRDGRDATGWQRLYFTFDPLHFGYFGGMLTKVIWFILGLTPGVLALTGTIMWWKRRSRVKTNAPAPAAAAATPAPAAAPVRGWVVVTIIAVGLAAAYAVVARDLGATFTHKFAEHWLVKPIALMAAFFPVTALLVWLALRFRARPPVYYAAWVGLAGWGVFLSSLFQG